MEREKLNYLGFKKDLELEQKRELCTFKYPTVYKKLEVDYKGRFYVSFLDKHDREFTLKTSRLFMAVDAYNRVNEENTEKFISDKYYQGE